MADSKEQEWIRTKKRTDRLAFGPEDETRKGYGRVNKRKKELDEKALEAVFAKFSREEEAKKRRFKPVLIKGSYTKYQ